MYCRRENFIPSHTSRICSWHFSKGKEHGPDRFDWNKSRYFDFPSPERRRKRAHVSAKSDESGSELLTDTG